MQIGLQEIVNMYAIDIQWYILACIEADEQKKNIVGGVWDTTIYQTEIGVMGEK